METNDLEKQTAAMAERAATMFAIVRDQPEYDAATDYLKRLKNARQRVADFFDPEIAKAYSLHKSLCAKKKLVDGPLELAESKVKLAIGAFLRGEETRRLAAQAEAAERERRRLEDEALAKATVAEAAGAGKDEIAQIMAEPNIAPTPIVAPTYQKAEGISTRDQWQAEVVNFEALVTAVAEGKVTIRALEPNLTVLGQLARAQRETFAIPGCRAVKRSIVVAREQ